MDYLSTPKTNSSKVNIRFLVNEALHKGTHIDRKVDGSNTLLHLAVEYDLHDCVTKLLSSGASSTIKNSQGQTAVDVALANGNQILLQVLGRREDYGKHLQLVSEENSTSDSVKQEKILPLTLGAVYEDYLDWTDAKRCLRLKELLESLKADGIALNQSITSLCNRKQKTIHKLEVKHNKLRDKEHDLCLRVWEVVQQERSSRKDFEQITEDVAKLKGLVEKAKKKVYWSGEVQVQGNVGLILNRNKWLDAHVEINGDQLVLSSSDGCSDAEDRSTTPDGDFGGSGGMKKSKSTTPSSSASATAGPLRRKIQQKAADAVSKTIVLESLINIVVKRQLASSVGGGKVSKSDQEYVITELVISSSEDLINNNNNSNNESGGGSGPGSRSQSPLMNRLGDRLDVLHLRIPVPEANNSSSSSSGGSGTTRAATAAAALSCSDEMEAVVNTLKSLCKQVKIFSSVGGFEVEEDEFSLSQCLAQELLHASSAGGPPEQHHHHHHPAAAAGTGAGRVSSHSPSSAASSYSEVAIVNPKVERQSSDPQSDLTMVTPGGVFRNASTSDASAVTATDSAGTSPSTTSAAVGGAASAVTRESMSYASGLTSIDSLVNTMQQQNSHNLRSSASILTSSSYSASQRHSNLLELPSDASQTASHLAAAAASESPSTPAVTKKPSNLALNLTRSESNGSSPRAFRAPSEVLFDSAMKHRTSRKARMSMDSSDPRESLFDPHQDVSASVPSRRASTSSSNDEWNKRRSSLSLSDQIKVIKNMNGSDVSVENVALVMDNVEKYDLSTLKRLLNTLRSKRDVIHRKVLDVITSREKLLEKLHFLQALRAVVDNPPRAPTRNLSSTKTPSIEKAVQMLSVYRDHVDNVIDDSTTSASQREKLSEAEDFVKIMLQDTNIIEEMAFQHDQPKSRSTSLASTVRGSRLSFDESCSVKGSGGGIGSNSTADIAIPRFKLPEEQQLSYGTNTRDLSVSFSQSLTNGSVFMTQSYQQHSQMPQQQQQQSMRNSSINWQMSGSVNVRSPMADALCDAARSPYVPTSSSRGRTRTDSNKLLLETSSGSGKGHVPSSSTQSFVATATRCESPLRTPSKSSSSGLGPEHISIRSSPWKMFSRKEQRESVLDSDAFGPLTEEEGGDQYSLSQLKEKSIDVAIAKHMRKSSQSTADGAAPSFHLTSPSAAYNHIAPSAVQTPAATALSTSLTDSGRTQHTVTPARNSNNAANPGSGRKHGFQIFGSPPAEFQDDYDEVMKYLEEIWNCELESFETVGRLAQCLVLREQTHQRLSRLKIQETTLVVPDQDDLYDIEL